MKYVCGFCGSELPSTASMANPSFWACTPECYLRWFAVFTAAGRAKIRSEKEVKP